MDGPDTQQDATVESTNVIAPMHVLVVEDDERIRDILAEMLNTLGHTAVMVSDAPSGLAALQKGHEFDVVRSTFKCLYDRRRLVGGDACCWQFNAACLAEWLWLGRDR